MIDTVYYKCFDKYCRINTVYKCFKVYCRINTTKEYFISTIEFLILTSFTVSCFTFPHLLCSSFFIYSFTLLISRHCLLCPHRLSSLYPHYILYPHLYSSLHSHFLLIIPPPCVVFSSPCGHARDGRDALEIEAEAILRRLEAEEEAEKARKDLMSQLEEQHQQRWV